MKNLSKLFAALVFGLIMNSALAQNESHPWAIKVGVNAIDFIEEGEALDDFRIAKTGNFNILPSISELSVSRYIVKGFSGTVSGSLNKIDKIGLNPNLRVKDLSYFSVEGMLSYDLRHLFNKKEGWFAPYIGLGGGYNWIEENGDFSANLSSGIDIWIKENIAISLEGTYKGYIAEYDDPGESLIVSKGTNTAVFQQSHIQYSVGIKFGFGGVDTDGDGVYDNKDECPEVAGTKEFNGCPDTDGDGIKDADDNCPDVAGPKETNGCPDTDGDGIIDIEDSCPKVSGLAKLKGCPDSDGDGVADNIDNCPNEGGPEANNGCPYKDTDGDGVLDKDDNCPKVKGVVSNNGCPKAPEVKKVTAEVQKTLNEYAKTILFDTGKSTIKKQSEAVLIDITKILKEYPTAKFTIDGHTDSVGRISTNQRLSESRAASVMKFLINKGVSQSNLTSKGYGESSPISSNATKEGRGLNRRVEINLVK